MPSAPLCLRLWAMFFQTYVTWSVCNTRLLLTMSGFLQGLAPIFVVWFGMEILRVASFIVAVIWKTSQSCIWMALPLLGTEFMPEVHSSWTQLLMLSPLIDFGQQLERLSLKDAHWWCGEVREWLPQSMLIKIVRHHRSLRWFRSDLTAEENIEVLKREHPLITFVTDSQWSSS